MNKKGGGNHHSRLPTCTEKHTKSIISKTDQKMDQKIYIPETY